MYRPVLDSTSATERWTLGTSAHPRGPFRYLFATWTAARAAADLVNASLTRTIGASQVTMAIEEGALDAQLAALACAALTDRRYQGVTCSLEPAGPTAPRYERLRTATCRVVDMNADTQRACDC